MNLFIDKLTIFQIELLLMIGIKTPFKVIKGLIYENNT